MISLETIHIDWWSVAVAEVIIATVLFTFLLSVRRKTSS